MCDDAFKNVSIVQNNFKEVCAIVNSWSEGDLDVFSAIDGDVTMYIDELHSKQRLSLFHTVDIFHM